MDSQSSSCILQSLAIKLLLPSRTFLPSEAQSLLAGVSSVAAAASSAGAANDDVVFIQKSIIKVPLSG
jgi:hypothetical protein